MKVEIVSRKSRIVMLYVRQSHRNSLCIEDRSNLHNFERERRRKREKGRERKRTYGKRERRKGLGRQSSRIEREILKKLRMNKGQRT